MYIVIMLYFFYIFLTLILKKIFRKINKNNINNYNLNKDGAIILSEVLSNSDINLIKNLIEANKLIDIKNYIIDSQKIKNIILNLFGPYYEFQDYIFILQKSKFNTCHRDYNGDFFNNNQKYKSYTIIFYLEDMEKCLDIIPKSHLSIDSYNINLTDITESIYCKKGDAILFDANLLHSGSLNKNENNLRIQMKISHINDINESLKMFQSYNKTLNIENKYPKWLQNFQKTLSCTFPFISNIVKDYDPNRKDFKNNIFIKYLYPKLDDI